jgi:DeoR family transcriptional regulator, fructose operon transcriptional repressor
MYATERQQDIVQRARREGRVDVAELAREFGVTTETVRRDLTRLERHGLVRRVHGGALPIERLGFEPAVDERAAAHTGEKQRIGKAAAAFLPQEGTVLIDAGTTTACLADALPPDRALTVVTNALPIALQLANRPRSTVLMLGGRVRGRTLAQVDAWALRGLAELHVDVAFIATNGLSVERGLTTPDLAEAEVKRAMVAAATRVVLLADSSKVGQVHFIRFASLADIDVLVTDDALDDRAAEEFQAAGVQVVRA